MHNFWYILTFATAICEFLEHQISIYFLKDHVMFSITVFFQKQQPLKKKILLTPNFWTVVYVK